MAQHHKIPQPQYYKIDLETARALYEQRALTAKGLFLVYLRIKLPEGKGWTFRKSVQAIAEDIGLSVKTIYKFLRSLAGTGFRWSVPAGTEFLFSNDSPTGESESPTGESESPTGESESPTGESESPTGESESPTGESQGWKPLQSKDSSPSIDSYQIFLISLSESEREKFLDFANQKVARLGIANLNDWLAASDKSGQARYLAMWQEFSDRQECSAAAAPLPGPESEPESQPEEYCPPPPGFFAQIFQHRGDQHRGEDNRGSGRRGLGGFQGGGFSAISDLLGASLSAGVAI